MKKLITLLLAAMMCLSLCACGEDTSDKTQPNETVNNQGGANAPTDGQTDGTPETTAPTTQPGIPLSDNLSDFTISIDGVVYQFPCSPQVFFDNGWLPRMDWILEDDYLYPGDSKGLIALYKEGENKEITLHCCNLSKNDKPLSKCIVFGIYNEIDTDVEFTLSGNLALTDAVTEQTILSVMESSDSQNKVEGSWYQLYFPREGEYTFIFEDGFLTYFDLTLSEAKYAN